MFILKLTISLVFSWCLFYLYELFYDRYVGPTQAANNRKMNELEELKHSIPSSVQEGKDQTRRQNIEVVLLDQQPKRKKNFKIDTSGNVEYIDFEELKK